MKMERIFIFAKINLQTNSSIDDRSRLTERNTIGTRFLAPVSQCVRYCYPTINKHKINIISSAVIRLMMDGFRMKTRR